MRKQIYEFGWFRLDPVTRTVWRGDAKVRLTGREFGTLLALADRAGTAVSADELLWAVWGDTSVTELSVRKHISALRQKLGKDADGGDYIVTIPNVGYQLAAVVVKGGWEDESAGVGDGKVLEDAKDAPATGPAAPLGRRAGAGRRVPLWAVWAAAVVLLAAGWSFWPQQVELLPPRQLTYDGREKGNLFVEGGRAYFYETIDGKARIASISVNGGPIEYVEPPQGTWRLEGISPVRHSLLLGPGRPDELFEFNPRSHALRQVPMPPGVEADQARWDGAGRRLAVADGNGVVSAFEPGGQSPARQTKFDGRVFLAGWDGTGRVVRLAVHDPKAGLSRWEEWWPDEGGRVRALPAFSPNPVELGRFWTATGQMAFVAGPSTATGDGGQVWVTQGEGQRAYRITADAWSWMEAIAIPGTDRIVATARPLQAKLLTLPPPGTGLARKEALPGVTATEIDYSADGKWMTYALYPEYSIWRRRTDGSELLRLTDPGIVGHQPHRSPDGTRVAFMGRKNEEGSHWRVFLVPSTGGPLNEIVRSGDDQGVPTWYPDGKSIVFGDLVTQKGFERASLHEYDLQTGTVKTIPAPVGLWTPRVSPEPGGKYLAALSWDNRSLYIRDNARKNWRKCVTMAFIEEPIWQKDAAWVQFLGRKGYEKEDVYRVGAACGAPKMVATRADVQGAGDTWVGVNPDGEPIELQSVGPEMFVLQWRLRRRGP